MHGFGGMGGFMGFGWLIWIIIIGVIVWAVTQFSKQRSGAHRDTGEQSPEDILKQRYARGEITREEYIKIKQDL